MFEPQNEIEPTIAANNVGISLFSGKYRRSEVMAVLDPRDDRHRAAADAVEQRDHLRHLRSSAPCSAAGTPTAAPITTPSAISQGVLEPP